MALTPLGPSPSRGSAPDAFAIQADNLLGVQLPRLVTEINALQPSIDAAAAAGPAATAAATSASASANYKGEWSTLTGALAIPASVSYNGSVWMLTSSTANVALITPGVSAQWLIINPDNSPLWSLIWS